MKKGKKYQDLVKSFDKQEIFEVDAAIAQVKKLATAKFDETIELHVKLGVDCSSTGSWSNRSATWYR